MDVETHAAAAQAEASIWAKYRRVWGVLSPRFRGAAIVLMAGTVAGAALEVFGLALLTALMSVITPGATNSASPWIRALLQALGPGSQELQAVRLVALCALTFAGKNVFMAGLAWVEATFAFRLQATLSDLAIRNILESDYEEVARQRPAEQINLMTADLTTLVFAVGLPTLTFVSEALLMFAVVGFLFWAEPLLTAAIVGVVGLAAFAVMRISRRAVGELGQRRQQIEDDRMRRLREVFEHLREVYVYRAASHATAQLRAGADDLARVLRAFQMLSTGPRFVLELVLVSVLLAAVLIGLQGGTRHALIVSVGVFAASGFRLLIGANRLIMSAQGIRFGQPALGRILGALRPSLRKTPTAPLAAAQPAHGADSLMLQRVDYRYPASRDVLLRQVDLELRPGGMVGIKGNSGAGKTTLLEVLAGLRAPTAGRMLLDGQPLTEPGRELFHVVGYLGQSSAIFSESIRRNVAYGSSDVDIDDARVWQALEKAQLANHVRSLPQGLHTELGSGALQLSGGQAQRLALARALYAQCRFLLLDEPTSALDPGTEIDVIATLAELARECGVLLVSHRVAPLQACAKVYELRQGRLVAVTPDGVIA